MSSLGWVALVLVAAAPDTRWGLTFRAPEGCIPTGELAQQVEARLGRAVFGAEPQLQVFGSLRKESQSPRWRAKLTLVAADGSVLGSREVSSDEPSCRALDAPLTLVVAVMIDPQAAIAPRGEPAPPPAPPPPPAGDIAPPPPALEPVPEPERTPVKALPLPPPPPARPLESPPARLPRSHIALGVEGGQGPAPAPTWSLSFSPQVAIGGNLRLDVRFVTYPFLSVASGRATGWLLGQGLGTMFGGRWRLGGAERFGASATLGAEGTVFVGTGTSNQHPRTDLLGRLDVLARAGLHWQFSDVVGVELSGEAGVTPQVATLRLVTPDGRPVDVPMGQALRLGLSLALTLPAR